MILAISLLAFIICWLALMVNFIIMAFTKSKLNKGLKKRLPKVRRNLNMQDSNFSFSHVKSSSIDLIKMFFNFGSKEGSTIYYNNFVDVQAIVDSKDNELKRLLNKSIRVTSRFVKIWIVMVISLLLAVLTWPN